MRVWYPRDVGRTDEPAARPRWHPVRGGARRKAATPERARNDTRQSDDLVEQWERPGGAFAALHWVAAAGGELITPARQDGELLLDVGCGGGLMADHAVGYVHVGLDETSTALVESRRRGVHAVRGDAARPPVAGGSASLVVRLPLP